MAIKIFVALEGAEDINAALDGMVQHSEAFADSINSIGAGQTGAGGGLKDITIVAGGASRALNEHNQSVHGVTEAYHILVPILREAGISFGDIRGFSLLARAGLEGLAVAITAIGVVALAKLEDQAKQTQGQLTDLFQSGQQGGRAFDAIKQAATDLGTTVGTIAPGFEALVTAWNKFVEDTRSFKFVAPVGGELPGLPPGMAGSVENLTTAFDTFFKLLRAGRLDEAQAATAATTFFTALQQGGKLTADVLNKLPAGTIDLIAQALGRGQIATQQFVNEVRLAPIPMDRLLTAFQRFGPQAQEAFDTRAIVTFRDVLSEILNSMQQGFAGLFGINFSDFLVGQLRKVKAAIEDTFADLKTWIEFFRNLEKATEVPFVGQIVTQMRQAADATDGLAQSTNDLAEAQKKAGFVLAPVAAEAPKGFITPQQVQATKDARAQIDEIASEPVPLPRPRPLDVDPLAGLKEKVAADAQAAADAGQKPFSQAIDFSDWLDSIAAGLKAADGLVQQFIDSLRPDTSPQGGLEIPLPRPKPSDLEATTQPILDAQQKAHDESRAIWEQPTLPLELGGQEQLVSSFGAFVDELTKKWTQFLDLVKQGIIAPAGAEGLTPAQIVQGEFQQLQPLPTPQPPIPAIAGPPVATTEDLAAQKAETDAIAESVSSIDQTWLSIDNSITEATDLISVMGEAMNGMTDMLFGIVSAFGLLSDAIAQATQNAQQLLQALIDLSVQSVPTINTANLQGAATGGLIRGVGTPTSDSNLIWASVNEFMQPARAVEHYGLSFMEAVRTLQFPRDLWKGARAAFSPPSGGFAQGGLVKSSNLRPIVLNIAGKGSFAGTINAPEEIVATLSHQSVFEQLAAGGRSPGWRRS